MTVKRQLNKKIEKLEQVEKNIDNYTTDELEDILYKDDSWLIKNDEIVKENTINTDKLKSMINLINEYIDNKNGRKTRKQTRHLTIINTVLLTITFVITYFGISTIKDIGPGKIIKSKNAEIYLIILMIIVGLLTYCLFYLKFI
jgi:Mg2+ and Co2+ transporter CorA